MTLLNSLKPIQNWLIDVRRDFHRHPELSEKEFRTSKKIQQYLSEMNIPYQTGIACTGIIGNISGISSNINIALRADIDALPIQDAKICSYRSTVEGVMHACGHDAHTTILLGTAKAFSSGLVEAPCEIRLIFQPAEETIGGAERMIHQGVLDGINGIFGLHVDSSLETGKIGIKYGALNASSDMITIKISGKSGHGAYPADTVDAIVIAAQVINALQTVISRNTDARETAVLSLGVISGGTARNIVADEVVIEGTIRTLCPKVRATVNEKVRDIVETLPKAFGGHGEYTCQPGYTSLINHNFAVDIVKDNAIKLLGNNSVYEKKAPNMGVEDFAYYLEKVPGAFFHLGVGNPKKNITAPGHNKYFDIDEDALILGVAMHILNIKSATEYFRSSGKELTHPEF
ncbi:amidohydrolase [Brevinema andersonii]|uniref:Amidohydrolase n=1 Tax=Brevinema andersonii TaxID=34097 RepID=A0A1I1DFR6_BREAD|nr:amidohydrolase [Brevinema andersonii]SFB71610.1 amidohydrolase [Brevinema andersonii]